MTEDERVAGGGSPSADKTLWVYGYEMKPSQDEQRMAAIRKLLDGENNEAKRSGRRWTARLVTQQQATHVMIVTTDPELDLEVNRKLEAELRALGGEILVTVPMPVTPDGEDT